MTDTVALGLAATATVLATGLGAMLVVGLGAQRVGQAHAGLSGFAGGAMGVAAIVGLLVPGLANGERAEVSAGLAAGVLFLVVVRRGVYRRPGAGDGATDGRWLVVAIVLFVHSFPEGLAIGTAYGSQEAGLAWFVVVAIALQNVPEGTATAMPMQAAGRSPAAQVATAVLTSTPQLPGAFIAYALVDSVDALLPVSFGFAAGAMLALTVVDMVPDALAPRHRLQGVAGGAVGAAGMLVLAHVAGV